MCNQVYFGCYQGNTIETILFKSVIARYLINVFTSWNVHTYYPTQKTEIRQTASLVQLHNLRIYLLFCLALHDLNL